MSILDVALDPSTVVVAVDPGKVMNRVWVSNGLGLLEEPVSLPVARAGIEQLEALLVAHPSAAQVIAIEATGSLRRAWAAELERRHPGALRVFAPSETKAARTQLGSGRFKTDDRDCAALTYLARQGAGRGHAEEAGVESLRAAVRHRRGLVADRKVAQQRLHDQLNTLCPGLSVPGGNSDLGRALPIATSTGQAVLACAVAFAGRAPTVRSLVARAPGRLSKATAEYWVDRWRGCLPPPADAEQRAARLGRDLARYRALQIDIADQDWEIEVLLASTDGQVLTTLPGVAVIRAAAFEPLAGDLKTSSAGLAGGHHSDVERGGRCGNAAGKLVNAAPGCSGLRARPPDSRLPVRGSDPSTGPASPFSAGQH